MGITIREKNERNFRAGAKAGGGLVRAGPRASDSLLARSGKK